MANTSPAAHERPEARRRAAAVSVVQGSFTVSSGKGPQLLDVTARIQELVGGAGVEDGFVIANTLHTTCCLFVNEFQGALVEDLKALMDRLVAGDGGYRHNDSRYSDCERGNAAAHLRVGLLGQSVALAIRGGDLSLGRFQSILLAEWDGPRERRVDVQIVGV